MSKTKRVGKSELVPSFRQDDFLPILQRTISGVRDELLDSPYIKEALHVLPVGGHRSAIGSFWNAVVDDLRRKVMHRSLSSFNREVKTRREVKTYEDFQDHVTDDELIEGAYKIGVIGWEARKMLLQAKQIRHVFTGHPHSSEPSVLKVLAMMDDCVKYVLSEDYPLQIVDIDDYMTVLGNEDFDRNEVAVENALGDLPETYKDQLVHRVLSAYVHPESSSVLRGNIEFVAPIFWKVLPKHAKLAVARRVDSLIPKSNKTETDRAFDFVRLVGGMRYLSVNARKYKLAPIIQRLKSNLDDWSVEDDCVKELRAYAGYIPPDLIDDYIWALTHTYVGYVGRSPHFARTDFFANGAAPSIQIMFTKCDDDSAYAFVKSIRSSTILHSRIANPAKLRRLRSLCHLVLERVSEGFDDSEFLQVLADESKEEEFLRLLTAVGSGRHTGNKLRRKI
ncbi:MAG: hypothetical protein JW889_14610 [Verrucomicrobia bacterium]|nr:hypothetical protein [Verrucomicrobiota bacterium]